MRTLHERNWIRVVGHREVPGRPELLGTTREFLDYFGLKSLDDLPTLAELQDLDGMKDQLGLPGELGEDLAVVAEGTVLERESLPAPVESSAEDDAAEDDDDDSDSDDDAPEAPILVAGPTDTQER